MAEDAIPTHHRRFVSEASRLVPGLYAWVATVLWPAVQPAASWWARLFAALALAALVAAFTLLGVYPRFSRLLGVHAFVLACLSAWALMGAQLQPDQLDPVRSALGGVGFLLHALAWGAPPRPLEAEASENLVPGSPLLPRQRPGRVGPIVFACGVSLALVPSLLAFGVERPGASLLAHALALGCALLLVAASADVALRIGKPLRFPAWRARTLRAAWSLASLGLALGVGLIWLTLS